MPLHMLFNSILPSSSSERDRSRDTMKARRVVLFAAPGVGHLVSMIELAKQILHHTNNFSITIFIMRPPSSSSPFASSSVSRHLDAVVASGLDINFVELPQAALPEVDSEGLAGLLAFIDKHTSSVFEALSALKETTTIPAFIVDVFCISSTSASLQLGIPTFVFFSFGATTVCLFIYLPEMDSKYDCDLKDRTEGVELPGSALRLPPSAIPAGFHTKKDDVYPLLLRNAHLCCELDGMLVNTFNELQPRAIEALAEGLCRPRDRTPPAYPVGPLLDLSTAGSDSNDHECIKWLDQQPNSSVLFLCFGSMGALPTDQIHEMARGLELSHHRFLWSLRARPSESAPVGRVQPRDADLDEALPAGFVERTRERGLVWPKWVPQVAILSHPAVGGFVSHCGWNSALESMWFGVPMIAWPLYAEQEMNAFELVNVLGVALAVNREGSDGMVRAEELKRAVRSLMEGDEEGTKVREKMKKMKESGRKAVEEGGSSFLNLTTLVERWSTG